MSSDDARIPQAAVIELIDRSLPSIVPGLTAPDMLVINGRAVLTDGPIRIGEIGLGHKDRGLVTVNVTLIARRVTIAAASDLPQVSAASAAEAAPAARCTATTTRARDFATIRCIQPAGHYDESIPIRDSDINGPTDPGGWHFAVLDDGTRCAWADGAEGATPHSKEQE